MVFLESRNCPTASPRGARPGKCGTAHVVGANPKEVPAAADSRVTLVSLGLQPVEHEPLRLTASIVLAEIARQVGRGRPLPTPPPRAPRYEKAIEPAPGPEVLLIEPADLLGF